MSNGPFATKALESAGVLNKLFRTQPKKNAFLELNNALAQAGSIRDVTLETVQDVNSRYSVDLHKRFRDDLQDLYRKFLCFCLQDRQFTQEEIDDLWHLKALFGITDQDHEKLYQETAVGTYKRKLHEILSDSTVTDQEKDALQRLSAYLNIPEDTRKTTFESITAEFLQKKADMAAADQQLSPQEEAELEALARSLGGTIRYDGRSFMELSRMRFMWHINNSPLPAVQIPINLQRGEICHFQGRADWHEHRRVTRRLSYGGPALRIKICKGLYWKAGSYGVQRESEDVLTKIDSGGVYLTNWRIIFNGSLKSQSIKFEKILDITPYTDGVGIEKDGGKSPVLVMEAPEIFVAMLARLIRDMS